MTSPLYNQDILRLATSLSASGRLDHPDATSDRRSPTCGSRVIVDLCLDDSGRVSELGLDVKACALGQASAALLARHATGRTAAELIEAASSLRDFLSSADEATAPDFWPGIAIFEAARAYPARHPSILLAFEAAGEAAAFAAEKRS